jgi:hypothetical protein
MTPLTVRVEAPGLEPKSMQPGDCIATWLRVTVRAVARLGLDVRHVVGSPWPDPGSWEAGNPSCVTLVAPV